MRRSRVKNQLQDKIYSFRHFIRQTATTCRW